MCEEDFASVRALQPQSLWRTPAKAVSYNTCPAILQVLPQITGVIEFMLARFAVPHNMDYAPIRWP